jgi:hypothetical protein
MKVPLQKIYSWCHTTKGATHPQQRSDYSSDGKTNKVRKPQISFKKICPNCKKTISGEYMIS